MSYRWAYQSDAGRHEWLFKRNCVMTPWQLGGWFIAAGLCSLLIALVFAWRGAWLVLPFSLIEIAGLALAFVWFARHAADYERVVLDGGRLVIETSLGQQLTRQERSASWLRVEYRGKPTELVALRVGRESFLVGRFVPDNRRSVLAGELRQALSVAEPAVIRTEAN